MAEENLPIDPADPERRRRLLTLYEMTGNPFLQGSPFLSGALRRGVASGSYDAPPDDQQRPHTALPIGPQTLEPQQAQSAALRGTPPPRPTPAPAADPGLTAIPTQGPQGSRSGRPPAAAEPEEDPRRKHIYSAVRQLDADMAMPDMTQAVDAYRRRSEGAGGDIAVGWMMSERGGRTGRELGGQVLKNALAMRQPQTTDYGTIDASGFTADPMKEREFKISRAEKKIALLEMIARDSENAEDRRNAKAAAEQLRRDQMRMHNENLAASRASRDQGKFAHYKDDDTGQVVLYNTRTGERVGGGPPGAGAPGAGAPGQFPGRVSPKATEDERRIASNVRRIVGSAALMTPEGAAPGLMEATAAQLPYVGEGAASAVRGASGTLGIGQKTRQSTFQSQADIVDALLYISTGAAYNKEQLATMREAYMPAYTDNAQARQNKATRLQTMIESAKVRAGRAWTQEAEDALQAAMPGLIGSGGGGAPTTQLPKTSLQRDLNDIKNRARGETDGR